MKLSILSIHINADTTLTAIDFSTTSIRFLTMTQILTFYETKLINYMRKGILLMYILKKKVF